MLPTPDLSPVKKLLLLTCRLLLLALTRPADLRHVLGVGYQALDDIAKPGTDIRRLACVRFAELATQTEVRIVTHFFKDVPASISPMEALALGLLLRRINGRRVFEFGTYKGVSTTQFAANLDIDGVVHTLDLPEANQQPTALKITKEMELRIAAEPGKGSVIPSNLRPKIEFLRQDSADFDPIPFSEKIDLVFVDGAHSADYVRNDSEKGWRMLRPGGVLVWHDFVPSHPEVVSYVLGCGYATARISGTALAFAVKDNPRFLFDG